MATAKSGRMELLPAQTGAPQGPRTIRFGAGAISARPASPNAQSGSAGAIAPAYPTIDNRINFPVRNQTNMNTGTDVTAPAATDSITAMEALVAQFRVRHEDQADVIIRNGGAPRRLSLTTYSIPRFSGEPANVLDLEAYVDCHLTALNATRTALTVMAGTGLAGRVESTARRLQAFFRALHRNLRQVQPPPRRIALPETGGKIGFDSLLMIETWLASRIWTAAADLDRFEEIFRRTIADPVNTIRVDMPQRYRHLLSILAAVADQ